MKKLIAAALIGALLLAGCSKQDAATESSSADSAVSGEVKPLATFEEYTVTTDEYSFFYNTMRYNLQLQALQNGYTEETMADFWKMDQEGIPMEDWLKQEALRSAKEYSILYKTASDAETKVADDVNTQSDAQIDELLEKTNGDENKFTSEYGFKPELAKQIYRNFNQLDAYQDSLEESIEVDEKEVRAVYDASPETYDEVIVRHVLIMCDDTMSEEDQAKAKEKAEDILAQVEGGADIAKLAAEHSEDPGSKDKDGEYTFGKGVMVAEFENWAFEASDGDTGMVKTSYGYHVMKKMGAVDEAGALETIKANLQQKAASDKISEMLTKADDAAWVIDEELYKTFSIK